MRQRQGVRQDRAADQWDDWLDQATDDELLWFARKCREHYARRLDAYDARGDGPMVNAMCAAAREVFRPGLRW